MVWRLMRLETFSCVSTNLLRNNIPDQVLVHHDKVNIRNSSVESFHLSLFNTGFLADTGTLQKTGEREGCQ